MNWHCPQDTASIGEQPRYASTVLNKQNIDGAAERRKQLARGETLIYVYNRPLVDTTIRNRGFHDEATI